MEMGSGGLHKRVTVSSLYPEILVLIFENLDVRDKGRVAQVCSAWREAAYHKSVWRNVEAKLHLRRHNPSLFPSLVRRGIRRIQVLSLRRSLKELVLGVPNMESLNMMGCFNLTDTSFSNALIQHMPSLTRLNLSMCKQVSDISLRQIARYLTSLEELDLGGCSSITNQGLMTLALELRHLKILNLRSCRHVSDVGIGNLAGFVPLVYVEGTKSLEYLGLQDCQKLTDEGLRYVSSRLVNLKSLNLSFCATVTDAGLKHIARMTSLQVLNLRSCDNISDSGLLHLAEGGLKLIELDVSFCDKIGDQGLLHISQGLFNLRSLSLNACPISDDGISRIVRTLSDLQILNIGQCSRITDKGLTLVSEHFQQLQSIDLYGCTNVTTVGLEKVMQLPHLNVLNLGLWQKQR